MFRLVVLRTVAFGLFISCVASCWTFVFVVLLSSCVALLATASEFDVWLPPCRLSSVTNPQLPLAKKCNKPKTHGVVFSNAFYIEFCVPKFSIIQF